MPASSGEHASSAWVFKEKLGTGSFGEVVLYEHKTTKELLAVKKVLHIPETNELLRRWGDEVAFMKKLRHDHIVKGLPVPSELEATNSQLPHLGMEFCSRGDLRKKLSQPAHVCGFQEAEVLLLARHISSAMEYLHSKNIIHRDIKPENIMIQDHGSINVYKLTDLGFAKDSKQQPATSFVGTKEYMAPELYSHTEYNVTADYWSFATVMSEIITGSRPFMLSGLPVVTWHKIIGNKSPKDIGYYENYKGEKAYAQSLPQPNQLCRPMRESFEKWLSLMLMGDPKTRGGNVRNQRRVGFEWLDMILNCKIVHVRVMINGQVESYPTKPQDTVFDLSKTLSDHLRLPPDQYLLILPDGRLLSDPNERLHSFFRNPHGQNVVYMFQKEFSVQRDGFKIPPRSELVSALLQSNHRNVSENGFKVMWKQALYHCHHLMTEVKERLTALQAFLNYNHSQNTVMRKEYREMCDAIERLKGEAGFFSESVNEDIKMYSRQAAGGFGFASAKLYESMSSSREEVQDITRDPEADAEDIEKIMEETNKAVYNMHKNTTRHKHAEIMNDTRKKSDAIFIRFKEENKVKRREDIDCRLIQEQVEAAHSQFCDLNREIFSQLREVQTSCQTITNLQQRISRCLENTASQGDRIKKLQKERQQQLWEVIGGTIKTMRSQAKLSRATSIPGSSPSQLTAQPPPPSSPGQLLAAQPLPPCYAGQPVNPGEQEGPTSFSSASSVLNQSFQDDSMFATSLVAVHDSHLQSMQEIKNLDWGYLDAT